MERKFTCTTDELLYEILLNLQVQTNYFNKQMNDDAALEISTRFFQWQFDPDSSESMTIANVPQYPEISRILLYSKNGTRLASDFTQNGNDVTITVVPGHTVQDDFYRVDIYHKPYFPQANYPPITGVTITPWVAEFDGLPHPVVEITGTIEGDVIALSIDGLTYIVMPIPEITQVNTGDFFVKVSRDGYADLIQECHCEITAAAIPDVVVTPVIREYDSNKSPIINANAPEGSIITYSEDGVVYLNEPPARSIAGIYFSHVRITKEGYADYNGYFDNCEITQKAINITADDVNVVYDGLPHSGTGVSAILLLGADTISEFHINGTGTEVGNYVILPTSVTIMNKTSNRTSSYSITFIPGSLNITEA